VQPALAPEGCEMVTRRTIDSPLHGGRAPRWLFERMVRLAREIVRLVVLQYGPEELLRRLGDPWWFQAFGCVLGFDWHASGLTTVTCGALKTAVSQEGDSLGLVVAGGKGKAALRTPEEITEASLKLGTDGENLVRTSRLVAKVDSAALQDGFQVYHHTFCFTERGTWCVVQQGMNEQTGYARRYHWLCERVEDFTCEPHSGILQGAGSTAGAVLNLVAREGQANRDAQVALTRLNPDKLEELLSSELTLPREHGLALTPFRRETLKRLTRRLHEKQAEDYASVLEVRGVGAKALRALALVAQIVHGKPPSYRDPAIFAYAHGGKDGVPFPVDRQVYDSTIEALRETVNKAKLGYYEKNKALKRLAKLVERSSASGGSYMTVRNS